MGKTIWFVCAFHISFLQACIRTARLWYIDSELVILLAWYLFFEITFRIISSVWFRVNFHSFIDSSLFNLSINNFAYLRLFLIVQSNIHQLNHLIRFKHSLISTFQYSETFVSVSFERMIFLFSSLSFTLSLSSTLSWLFSACFLLVFCLFFVCSFVVFSLFFCLFSGLHHQRDFFHQIAHASLFFFWFSILILNESNRIFSCSFNHCGSMSSNINSTKAINSFSERNALKNLYWSSYSVIDFLISVILLKEKIEIKFPNFLSSHTSDDERNHIHI